MVTETTSLQRLQQTIPLMDQWIAENKPSESKSQEIFNAFIQNYNSEIRGRGEFIVKAKKVIEKASRLATGACIMQRLLDTNIKFPIKDGGASFTHYDSSQDALSITIGLYNPKLCYVGLNHQGGPDLIPYKGNRTIAFIHECLHVWHRLSNSQAKDMRLKASGTLPGMDNEEEEFTITGNLHLENTLDRDLCCENTALREYNLPPRINHQGADAPPDLHDFVRCRLISKIQELSLAGQIHNEKKNNSTALELAFFSYFLEKDSNVQEEWIEIIGALIQAGSFSEKAFKMAILCNSQELIKIFIKAGVGLTNDLLICALQKHDDRLVELWEILEISKQIVSEKSIHNTRRYESMWLNKIDLNETPSSKMKKQQMEQFAMIREGVLNNKASPIHTLASLTDFLKDCEEKTEWINWIQSHSDGLAYHAPQSIDVTVEELRDIYETLCQPNRAFTLTLDGSHLLSLTDQSYLPKCYKDHKIFGLPQVYQDWYQNHWIKSDYNVRRPTPNTLFFTPEELKAFISVLGKRDMKRLANTFSDCIMRAGDIGMDVVGPNTSLEVPIAPTFWRDEFLTILSDFIQSHIETAFSSLSDGLEKSKQSYPIRYGFDIPLTLEKLQFPQNIQILKAVEGLQTQTLRINVVESEYYTLDSPILPVARVLSFLGEIIKDGRTISTFV